MPYSTKTAFAFGFFSLLAGGLSQAENLIQWGPSDAITSRLLFMREGAGAVGMGSNYGTAPKRYEGDLSLNLDQPSNPPFDAGTPRRDHDDYYAVREGVTPLFHAAVTTVGSSVLKDFRISDNVKQADGMDAITLNFLGEGENEGLGLFYWPAASSGGTLQSLRMQAFRNSQATTESYRWLIRLNGAFYLSADQGAIYKSEPTPFVLNDPGATEWYAYAPTENIASLGEVVELTDFSGFEGAGVLFHANDQQRRNLVFYLTEFVAE